MSVPQQSFDPPIMTPMLDESGRITGAWQVWADRVCKAVEVLRQASDLMEDLDPVTATAEDCADAWEAFREKLQEIV